MTHRPRCLAVFLALSALFAGAAAATTIPVLVKDIETEPTSSYPSGLTPAGERMFLFTDDGDGVNGLWVTDGTPGGTTRLADVDFLYGYASSSDATAVGGNLFFLSAGPTAQIELWKSDGTAPGTVKVVDTAAWTYSSFGVAGLSDVGGTLLFYAPAPSGKIGVWRSDGTAAGTSLVSDAWDYGPFWSAVSGGKLYFAAQTAALGAELWVTDGTTLGTGPVADINPGPAHSLPDSLVDVDGVLYFAATDATTGHELWRTDGTVLGTMRVADLMPGAGSSNPYRPVNAGGTLYFFASTPGTALWRSNGTPAGTTMVSSISSPPAADWAVASGSRIFWTHTSGYSIELWTSDGTGSGTALVHSGLRDNYPQPLAVMGGRVYWATSANASVDDVELWASNGTVAGTSQVADVYPGTTGSKPQEPTALGSHVFFSALGPEHGTELWRTDGTAAGTIEVDLSPGSASPSNLTPVGSRLAFLVKQADPLPSAQDLWVTDGTQAGTVKLADAVSYLVGDGTTAYFTGSSYDAWKTDGTPAGTVQLAAPAGGVHEKLPVGGQLLATVGASDVVTIDPATGTVTTLSHIAGPIVCSPRGICFDFGAYPSAYRETAGKIFFLAAGQTGFVWTTDLTAAGTQSVAAPITLDPRYGFNPPWDRYELAAADGVLYLPNDPNPGSSNGLELWRSDGTSAGTYEVADVNPGPGSANPSSLTAVGSTIFFTAEDNTSGRELWKTTGTAPGTARLADIRPGASGSDPRELANGGGVLYFSADDGTRGRELWKSDGTAAVFIKDINPGPAGSDPKNFFYFDGLVYFQARDGTTGAELWQTDGTEEGTVRVADMAPGGQSARPSNFGAYGGTLYFSAYTPASGNELWKLGDGQDADGDGVDDSVDACVNVAGRTVDGARVTLTRLDPPSGDSSLAIRGEVVVPVSPSLDPMATGLRVLLLGADGSSILDATVPPGAYDPVTRQGWKPTGAGARYRSTSGIRSVKVKLVPGLASIKVKGKDGDFAVPPAALPLTLTIVFDPTDLCGETEFAAAACVRTGGTARCR